jgi:hypothetical protein
MMKHYMDSLYPLPKLSGPIEDWISEPYDENGPLGEMVYAYSRLLKSLDKHIGDLAERTPSVFVRPVRGLNASEKVSILCELVQWQLPERDFNTHGQHPELILFWWVQMVLKCERLRNDLLCAYFADEGLRVTTVGEGKSPDGALLDPPALRPIEVASIVLYIHETQTWIDDFFAQEDESASSPECLGSPIVENHTSE